MVNRVTIAMQPPALPRLLLAGVLLTTAGCQALQELDARIRQAVGVSEPADPDSRSTLKSVPPSAAESAYVEGLQHSLEGRDREAVASFYFAAERSHEGARYLVGMSYLAGTGVERDPQQARRWLEPLAEAGHAGAQYHVGEMYMNGAGVAVEPAWAVQWYERAAELGFAKAQFAAGVAYATGMAGIKDLSQGWFWLRRAERAQQPHASELLLRLRSDLPRSERERIDVIAADWQAHPREQRQPRGQVRFVQYALQRQGLQPGPLDGWWGPQTASALATFQRRAGLPETGLNKATLDALRRSLLAEPV